MAARPLYNRDIRNRRRPLPRFWSTLSLVAMSLAFVAGTSALILFPLLPSQRPYRLQIGDIVPEDIRAPAQISYTSQIETDKARAAAAARVDDIYDPPSPRIGRQQVLTARQALAFIQVVRADPFANDELKHEYLSQIEDLSLPNGVATKLLTINDLQFDTVGQEIVSLIEEAMSGAVNEGQEQQVRNQLELHVSSTLSEDLIPVAVAVAGDLVVANSKLNVVATEEARNQAADEVRDVQYTFQEGEVVIRAGDQVDELALEALNALGLASEERTWQDVASMIIASVLALITLAVYLAVFNPSWINRIDHLLLLIVLFLAFLALAQLMLPENQLVAYLFPAAALSLAMAEIIGVGFAALTIVVLAILTGILAANSLEITVFTALSGLLAAGSIRRSSRLSAYFVAGIFASLGSVGVLLVFRLPEQMESFRLAQYLSSALVNGLLSAGIALVILFVVGNITDLTTSVQMIDLTRPDHPLQRLLQQEAVGTYHHTLSVANLAEAAAEIIGADALLTRVGSLYHDVGKALNPGFFVENRTEGAVDPHRGLSPQKSAELILAHVPDGAKLARKHRLPPAVIDFIWEHHGTTPIAFFLERAREEAEKTGSEVDERLYHYSGPIPHTRETAILMLADGCESAVRSNQPAPGDQIEQIVTHIIQLRLDQHQLDNSGLTLTDIKMIKDTFIRTLKGMYHPRVKYPGDIPAPAQLPASSPEGLPQPVQGEGEQAAEDTSKVQASEEQTPPPRKRPMEG
jgi:putative nucleotidyltransferase with HDIG domain